jgi:uncharacterized protein YrzB (UPF0473 family)
LLYTEHRIKVRRYAAVSEEYGSDFITITDEDGNEFELEHLDTIEYGDDLYMAFLPAGPEDSEDYGMVILKVIEENGEEILATVDDEEELNKVYDRFMEQLFADEGESASAAALPQEAPAAVEPAVEGAPQAQQEVAQPGQPEQATPALDAAPAPGQ